MVFTLAMLGFSVFVGHFIHGVVNQTQQEPPPEILLKRLLASDYAAPASRSITDSTSINEGSQPLHPSPVQASPTSLGSRLFEFHSRAEGIGRPFRIVQFGDSHTAGDLFTEQLRRHLQSKYGNGGIGWIIPGPVPGQSSARYNVSLSGLWSFETGRSKLIFDMPLGGFSNTGSVGSKILVNPVYQPPPGMLRFGALVQSKLARNPSSIKLIAPGRTEQIFSVPNHWTPIELRFSSTTATPFILKVVSGRVEVSGLWLEREASGVVLDHVGRNGATISAFDRWSDSSIARQLQARPVDAILLAYGTNESMDNITASGYVAKINNVIKRLRLASSDTPIILLTAPSFAANNNVQCRQFLPPSLRRVINAQIAAGSLPGVHVWNWMLAMGGECAVADWARAGLMRDDRIHMTPLGYRRSADLFYAWLQTQIPSHR
jgi:lysophospholipase L1-like esterase